MSARADAGARDQAIADALRRVHDPCALAQGIPMSVYDLGLVRDWTLDEAGHLEVRMCVTAPLCMMSRVFLKAAEEQLESLPWVTSAGCHVDPSVVWTPLDMTEQGRARMLAARSGASDGEPGP